MENRGPFTECIIQENAFFVKAQDFAGFRANLKLIFIAAAAEINLKQGDSIVILVLGKQEGHILMRHTCMLDGDCLGLPFGEGIFRAGIESGRAGSHGDGFIGDFNSCGIFDGVGVYGVNLVLVVILRLGNREICERLRDCVRDCLSSREAKIITLCYGLDGGEARTQRETAALCKISRSYVSRIEKRALEKLRAALGEVA